jgi:HAD superfamily hydrolase (TIGR01549 family)
MTGESEVRELSPSFVFLDFGGTLARQTNTREEAIVGSLTVLGHSFSAEQVAPALAAARQAYADRSPHNLAYAKRQEYYIGMYEVAVRALGFSSDAREVAEHVWDTQRDSYALYPQVVPALQALRALGMRLGIISNWDKLNLAEICSDLGIADLFDVILPSAAVDADKPDPRIFYGALEMAGEHAESCVHIGDSFGADVQGARGAGMVGILVQRDGARVFDCPTVRGLDELPELLPEL